MLNPADALIVTIVFVVAALVTAYSAIRKPEGRRQTVPAIIVCILIAGVTSTWWIGHPLVQ